jgi:hypothetical protein
MKAETPSFRKSKSIKKGGKGNGKNGRLNSLSYRQVKNYKVIKKENFHANEP